MADQPLGNGANGRDAGGRFTTGNPGGPGNPIAKRTADVKQAFLEAVTADDQRPSARKLVEQAKAGDANAAKIVLDRVLGKVCAPADPNVQLLPRVFINMPDNVHGPKSVEPNHA